jgi:hypothetical protein
MRVRRFAWAFAALLTAAILAAPAHAALLIHIDKSAQRMTVVQDGETLYVWPVSTGIARYDTPAGEFKPFRMERDHFSREWDDAPMPYSIFFTMKGHAIHGTNHRSLGRPASHGCVRLSVAHAARLWTLVRREKMANTRVILDGVTPDSGAPAMAGRGNDYRHDYSTDDDNAVATMPQRRRVVRGWREYSDGPRFYYDRQRPYYPPPRRDPFAAGPFEFLFGR